MNTLYDLKYLKKLLIIYAVSLAALKFSGGNAFLAIIPFFLGALFTNQNVNLFACVIISTSLLQTNAYLAPKPALFVLAYRSLFMILGLYAGLQLLGQRKHKVIASAMIMLIYLFYMFIPSFLGWCPIVAGMKLVLYITVMMGYMAVANRCINTKNSEAKLRSLFLATALYFIVGSLLLIPFPGISNMTAEEAIRSGGGLSLFKGMTMHSQSMGPLAVAIGLMALGDLLINIQKPNKIYLAILFCVPILVYKTSSRTAMGTLIIGIMILLHFFMQMRGVKSSWRTKVMSVAMALVTVASILILVIPQTRDGITKFILKYDNSGGKNEVTMEETVKTRQGKVEEQIYHFKQKPAIGWGFQVSEEMAGRSGMQLLSAAVEKGVWVTAILEEGGVFGWILYFIFFLTMLTTLIGGKYILSALMFSSIHISNLGEMSMFSLTAIGGFCWLMFFFALVLDAARINRKKYGNMAAMYGYRPVNAGIGYNPLWR